MEIIGRRAGARILEQEAQRPWSHLHHVGGRHAEDSTAVAVPDSGLLLLGDCIYPPPYHLRQPDEGYNTALIHGLLDADTYGDIDWYVGSHAAPMSPTELQSFLAEE